MIQAKYHGRGRNGHGQFRSLSLAEAKALAYGNHIWVLDGNGRARSVKINGKAKVWKRSPDRVEIPWKYGLYEYGRFDESDVTAGRLLVEAS